MSDMRSYVQQAENYPLNHHVFQESSYIYNNTYRPKSQAAFRSIILDNSIQERQKLLLSQGRNQERHQVFEYNKMNDNSIFMQSNQYTLNYFTQKKVHQREILPPKIFRQKQKTLIDAYSLNQRPLSPEPQVQQLLSIKSLCNYGNKQKKELVSELKMPVIQQAKLEYNYVNQMRLFQRKLDSQIPIQKIDAKFFSAVAEWELINKKKLVINM